MKTFCFAILILGYASILQAQYYVIEISKGGSIYADGKVLKKRDRIESNAKLRFDPLTSYAKVMIPGKPYLILGVGEKDRQKSGKGEFLVALKEALFPPNEYPLPGTRGDEVYVSTKFADQYDIKTFFRNDIFLLDAGKFEVPKEHFPLDSLHYFTIRHQIEDGWFAKRLPHTEQTFEVSDDVFTLKDFVFESEEIRHSELYFVDEEMGEERYLGRFQLQFLPIETIQDELTWLYNITKPTSSETFLNTHALPYLHTLYGKTQPTQVMKVIEALKK